MGCLINPTKGKETFQKLKNAYGYKVAAYIFNRISHSSFISVYKDSLTLDSEGIPTFESIMELPIVQKYLGKANILTGLNKAQPVVENTANNVNDLCKQAYQFNQQNKEYVALVDYTHDNKLTIKVVPKSEESIKQAEAQRKIQQINEFIFDTLKDTGITLGHLNDVETAAGMVGETNFEHAADVASQFANLIRIANNMEGVKALSEEFAHLLVAIYKGTPMMERALTYLANEKHAREVLGDKYDSYLEKYRDESKVAEEALGHLLQEQLIQKVDQQPTKKLPIVKRIFEAIKSLFKGKNPAYLEDGVLRIKEDLSKLASDFLQNKKTITKKDITKTFEHKRLYALTGKAKQQADVLQKIVERSYREIQFTKDTSEGTERLSQKHLAESMEQAVNDNLQLDDTMAAIAQIVQHITTDLEESYKALENIEDKAMLDRQIILRNVLTTIQSYKSSIEDLYSILSKDYLNDESILGQHCMISDTVDALKDVRTDTAEPAVDTSNMSVVDIAALISRNADNYELTEDKKYYIEKNTGKKYLRVTEVIQADREGTRFDPNDPYVTPSTNIGTGIDEFIRDFLGGRIQYDDSTRTWKVDNKDLADVYPNATSEALNKLAFQLNNLRRQIRNKGITLITRDVVVNGTVSTVDAVGTTHQIRVAGTLDLLGYDQHGNWYIYDMKTHKSALTRDKLQKYERQLTLYKKFLEEKYGIRIKSLSIIPIKVNYPAPVGSNTGTANYTVKEEKPEGYNGVTGNQLIMNGVDYKGTNPYLEKVIPINARSLNLVYSKLSGDAFSNARDKKELILDTLKTVSNAFNNLQTKFDEVSLDGFIAFLKPFIGDEVSIFDEETKDLKSISLREFIKNNYRDVGTMERWLDNAANSSHPLIKIFDKVIRNAKEDKRLAVIRMTDRILSLAKKYEDLGIKNFDFMFEADKGRYINKLIIDGEDYSYDYSAYQRALANENERLNALYGEHPLIGTLEYKEKNEALRIWYKENMEYVSIDGIRKRIPDHNKYPSRYNSLSETQKQFYEEWMEIKEELDAKLPNACTFLENSIKIRKTNIERAKGLITKGDFAGLGKEIKSQFVKDYADDINYRGKTGLNNEEVLTLPIYYVKGGKDNSDLTTDVISSLIAYADMAINYEQMEKITPALEIGKETIRRQAHIKKTSGNRTLQSVFKTRGKEIVTEGEVPVESSKMWAQLNDMFEAQIYDRVLSDSGEIFGADTNKVVSALLKLGSTVQLGFNALAHLATAATGIGMINIEACCGQYFTKRQLAKADGKFISMLGGYVQDIGARINHSELALFDQLFNVEQKGTRKLTHKNWKNNKILLRIFGPHLQFFGQDAADFWLKNRVAIAMALNYELDVLDKDGNKIRSINLIDALEKRPLDPEHPERGHELYIPDNIVKKDGTAFTDQDIKDFSTKVGEVNRNLFGIYNQEDMVAARRYITGRFLLQYRDWMFPQYRRRFGKRQYNYSLQEELEGYYRTTWNLSSEISKELIHGRFKVMELYHQLPKWQQRNVKRCLVEITQYMIIVLLCSLLGGRSKDKDRSFIEKWILALALRERTELGALTIGMPKELLNIVRSPVANSDILRDIWNLLNVVWPGNYMDEIESGDYAGHVSAYKYFMNSPFTLQYKNIKKFFHPEKMISYYESMNNQ